jgi:hypothetical protein
MVGIDKRENPTASGLRPLVSKFADHQTWQTQNFRPGRRRDFRRGVSRSIVDDNYFSVAGRDAIRAEAGQTTAEAFSVVQNRDYH